MATKLIKPYIKIALLGGAMLSGACVTKEQPVKYKGNFTVVQSAGGSNLMSNLGRNHWVEIRRTNSKKKAKIYAALGAKEWDIASRESRSLLRSSPKDKDGLIILATALAMEGQFALSSYYADLIVKYHGDSPDVHNLRGLALLRKPMLKPSDYKKALGSFRKAYYESGRQVASGLNYGFLNLSMGRTKTSLGVFRSLEKRCSDCTPAKMGHGIALIRLGKYKSAKRIFNEIHEREPDNLRAHYRLALVEKSGYNNMSRAQYHLRKILADPRDSNYDVKRRAYTLLRRLEGTDKDLIVPVSDK